VANDVSSLFNDGELAIWQQPFVLIDFLAKIRDLASFSGSIGVYMFTYTKRKICKILDKNSSHPHRKLAECIVHTYVHNGTATWCVPHAAIFSKIFRKSKIRR
jgi:hypothetical protein